MGALNLNYLIMTNDPEKIDAVAKLGGTTPSGKAYAIIEYYMVDSPNQKEWRKIPGYIIEEDADLALAAAKKIASQLDGLTLRELPAAYRQLFTDTNSPMQRDCV